MKRKLRKLLTIALALGLILAMTTGVASATIINRADGSQVQPNDRLTSNTAVYSDNSSGMRIVYNGLGHIYEDTYEKDDDAWLIPADANRESYQGYLLKWEVTSIGLAGSTDKLELKLIEKVPINYTIQYYDGNTLIAQENVTAESNSLYYDGRNLKKDGYTFSHWANAAGDNIIQPGIPVDILYLSTNETEETRIDDMNYTIKLYAAWQEVSTPTKPEVPLDKSPDAGDDSSAGLFLLLMTGTAIGAAVVSRRKAA